MTCYYYLLVIKNPLCCQNKGSYVKTVEKAEILKENMFVIGIGKD